MIIRRLLLLGLLGITMPAMANQWYIPIGGGGYRYYQPKADKPSIPTGYQTPTKSLDNTSISSIFKQLKLGKGGYFGIGYEISEDFKVEFNYLTHWTNGDQLYTETVESFIKREPSPDRKGSHSSESITPGFEFENNPWVSSPQGTPSRRSEKPTKKSRTPSPTRKISTRQTSRSISHHLRGPTILFKPTFLALHPKFNVYGVIGIGLLSKTTAEKNLSTQWDIPLTIGAGFQWKMHTHVAFDASYTSTISQYRLSSSKDTCFGKEKFDLFKAGLQIYF